MSHSFDFSFLRDSGKPPRPRPRTGCRIVVLGDFAGRGHRKIFPGPRRLHDVDFDSFEAVMRELRVAAELEFGDEILKLEFGDLDAFHPDALLQNVPALGELGRQRDALRDPQLAQKVLDEVSRTEATPEPAATSADDDLFERLLGRRHSDEPTAGGMERWLADIVGPFVVPSPDPRAQDLVRSTERAISKLLRDILHHPEFRDLESAWLGLRWLLEGLELGADLRVEVLDLSRQELRDATTSAAIAASSLHRLLVAEPLAAEDPVSLLVPLESFAPVDDDLATLAALGALGAQGGFAVIGTAMPGFCNVVSHVENESADWHRLRATPQANAIGLATPDVVLRLPYGPRTAPVEALDFDELAVDELAVEGPSSGEPATPAAAAPWNYTWGPGGLAVARILGAGFGATAWPLARLDGELRGMPFHTFPHEGATRSQPCTRELLDDRALATHAAAGLMTLQGSSKRDVVRLTGLRSIAPGTAGLAGPWQS